MRRERLVERLEACGKGLACGAHHVRPLTDDEFAVLARAWAVENGWVDPANFPENMKPGDWKELLLQAEVVVGRSWAVKNGWVEPKTCGECDGDGFDHGRDAIEDPCERSCPSCGGTGRERLVAIDPVILDAVRRHYEIESQTGPTGSSEHQRPRRWFASWTFTTRSQL